MSKVTNLNRVRKDRARAEKRAKGNANAARFGRTGAEKALERATAEKARRDLDGHRRQGDGRDGDEDEGNRDGGKARDGADGA